MLESGQWIRSGLATSTPPNSFLGFFYPLCRLLPALHSGDPALVARFPRGHTSTSTSIPTSKDEPPAFSDEPLEEVEDFSVENLFPIFEFVGRIKKYTSLSQDCR